MEANCVVLREFNVPGGTMYPGRELGLNAILLEKWVLSGFVELIGPEAAKNKPKSKRTRGKHGRFVGKKAVVN